MTRPALIGSARLPKGNLSAIGIMLMAVGVFSGMDWGLKTLSTEYPPLEVTVLRAGASLPFMLGSVAWSGAWRQLSVASPAIYVARAALGLLMLASFIYSVSVQPLSESYAEFMSAPLMVAVLSRLILRERISLARWSAILVGFVGVLVALRPSAHGFASLGGLGALTSAACYAGAVLMIRRMSRTDSSHALVLWYMAIIFVASAALALPHWKPIEPHHWPVIAVIGATGALAQHLITSAFRRAPASVIAPFEYTALPWGVAIDLFFFQRLPASRVFVGGVIVVLSGLYLVYDEHRSSRQPR
jgi:drug/metabolite transporter (DMT)-like permease